MGCSSTKSNKNKLSSNIIPKSNISQLAIDESAMLKLKQCRDNLKHFSKRLLDQENRAKLQAKNFLKSNNRDRAKTTLALSKMYRIQSENTNNQIYIIEEQIVQIESTKNQNQVYKVLEQGNKTLLKLQNEIKIEDIEKVQNDLEYNREKYKEINDFFQQNGVDLVKNDKDIENELENILQLQAEEIKEDLPNPSEIVKSDYKLENKSNIKQEIITN